MNPPDVNVDGADIVISWEESTVADG